MSLTPCDLGERDGWAYGLANAIEVDSTPDERLIKEAQNACAEAIAEGWLKPGGGDAYRAEWLIAARLTSARVLARWATDSARVTGALRVENSMTRFRSLLAEFVAAHPERPRDEITFLEVAMWRDGR